MIEDGKRDIATRISVAEKRARAEGRAEGEAKRNRENAKDMKKAGIAVSLIASITGLSEDKIMAL